MGNVGLINIIMMGNQGIGNVHSMRAMRKNVQFLGNLMGQQSLAVAKRILHWYNLIGKSRPHKGWRV